MLAFYADSYEKVKENEIVEALQERAKMIVGMELLCESRSHQHSHHMMQRVKIRGLF
eukprot:COSAG06_NODE_2393_length_6959_cov_2.624781_4_plen_57_part_00